MTASTWVWAGNSNSSWEILKMLKKVHNLIGIVVVITATISILTLPGCESAGAPAGLEASRQIFPSATEVSTLSLGPSSPEFPKVFQIKGPSGLLGYCVDHRVVSRSGPFMINVILDDRLYIKRATVTSYPAERGRQVRSRRFTGQFEGKGPKDPIQIGKDIDAITSATISSRVMAQGIRNIVKLLKSRIETADGKR
jgi:hypothetical protein